MTTVCPAWVSQRTVWQSAPALGTPSSRSGTKKDMFDVTSDITNRQKNACCCSQLCQLSLCSCHCAAGQVIAMKFNRLNLWQISAIGMHGRCKCAPHFEWSQKRYWLTSQILDRIVLKPKQRLIWSKEFESALVHHVGVRSGSISWSIPADLKRAQ